MKKLLLGLLSGAIFGSYAVTNTVNLSLVDPYSQISVANITPYEAAVVDGASGEQSLSIQAAGSQSFAFVANTNDAWPQSFSSKVSEQQWTIGNYPMVIGSVWTMVYPNLKFALNSNSYFNGTGTSLVDLPYYLLAFVDISLSTPQGNQVCSQVPMLVYANKLLTMKHQSYISPTFIILSNDGGHKGRQYTYFANNLSKQPEASLQCGSNYYTVTPAATDSMDEPNHFNINANLS